MSLHVGKPLETPARDHADPGQTIKSMPNINALFKSEVARLVRKEMRAELQAVKKATGAYRSEIAALKRRTQSLEKQLGRLQKTTARRESADPEDATEPSQSLRFSAKGFAS